MNPQSYISMALFAAFWVPLALMAYSLALYPTLMRMAGRGKQAQPALDRQWPTVSLIIPAYNEEKHIARKTENALALDYPKDRLQILVASDGSTDRTVEVAQSFADRGIDVMAFAERRGKTAVINDAAVVANGDVLCLCDANVMFQCDALRRLVVRLDDLRVGAVSGDVQLASNESSFGEGETAYYGMERSLQLGESRMGSMMGVDGGMYVVRRELYKSLPADTIVDDFVLSMRVIRQGKRVVYEPGAVGTENGTPAARQEFRRRVRLTAGAIQALKRGDFPPYTRPVELWQFVSHKLLRWLGPVWLLSILISSALLWNEGAIYQFALLGQLSFYLLAVAATLLLKLRQARLGGIVFYFVMSHVAMAVGLVKGLFNRQPVTWQRTERTPVASEPEATAVH